MSTNKTLLAVLVIVIVGVVAFVLWQSKQATENTVANSNSQNTNAPLGNLDPTQEAPAHPSDASNFEKDLKVKNWTLWKVTLDKKVIDMDVKVGKPLNIEFDTTANTFNGFAGCNSFSGQYIVGAEYKFSFGNVLSTKMACDAMDLETSILSAMSKTATTGIKGEQLVFTSADGYTELVFDQAK